jgi:hypothetical protein
VIKEIKARANAKKRKSTLTLKGGNIEVLRLRIN